MGRTVAFWICSIACLATLGLWVRSYLPDHLHTGFADGKLLVLGADERLTTFWYLSRRGGPRDRPDADLVPTVVLWRSVRSGSYIAPSTYASPGPQVPINKPPVIDSFLGVDVVSETVGTTRAPYTFVAIPLLYPALAFATFPAVVLVRRYRNRQRHSAGMCRNCGYDIRATPDRCPECGSVPASASAPPTDEPRKAAAA